MNKILQKEVVESTHQHLDAEKHVKGQSTYLDDIPVMQGCLFGYVLGAPVANAHLKSLDTSKAAAVVGVIRIFTAKDIPGENQIGGIIPDEPLLAKDEIHFQDQPLACIVATTEAIAKSAAQLIQIDYETLPVITDPREACEKGELIIPPRTFELGDASEIMNECVHVFSGRADTGGQEHLYLETQGAYAHPVERDSIKIYSSTQGPTAVQRTTARVLGLGMHQIEVDVTRLGGGFGGKEDQATVWAVLAALGAYLLQQPVKIVLHRMDDMRMTGKRHPYSADYKIGLDKDLRILAYEVTFYQNAGAAADLSPAVLERTLFHATNSYFIPNVKATAYSCRTNLPPNTAFRGFGGPQGMFVIEAAIRHAAEKLDVSADLIQEKNLIRHGQSFSYGQLFEEDEASQCWREAARRYNIQEWKDQIKGYNNQNTLNKKGWAAMPVCFGISFTNTQMNHARALVHVYSDGTVGISTGAVEMGQGVNSKMVQVAAACFGLPYHKIKIETTNTTRVANTSPSAASATADLNGKALLDACEQIRSRLIKVAAETTDTPETIISFVNGQVVGNTSTSWEELVATAFSKRINLSAKGHYATPIIQFDKEKGKGHPFAYHVCGTAFIEVTVDCLRGRYEIDAVKLVHDAGTSMNRLVDLGQVEGGLVQGIGWMTMEEVIYNTDGKLLSNALSTYKIPDIYAAPGVIDVHFLQSHGSELAIFKSKAVGEPPLMYGIGVWFALRDAIKAFNPALHPGTFTAPMTPERVLMDLYEK